MRAASAWPLLLCLGLWACEDQPAEDNPRPPAADAGLAVDGAGGDGDAGGGGPDAAPPGRLCAPGETRCVDGRLRTCLEEGDGWLVERCEPAEVCREGACVARLCDPGSRRCAEDGLWTCDAAGEAWLPGAPCPEGTACADGVCLGARCTPGDQICGDRVAQRCDPDGLTWTRTPCADGEVCLDGACAPPPAGGADCPPGEVICGPTGRRTCAEDGIRYVETPCPEGQACFEGACVACVRDRDCPEGRCEAGACQPPALEIRSLELPVGQRGVDYEARFEAAHGAPPYRWSVAGALPAGLGLNPTGDGLSGRPEAAGEFPLVLAVEDGAGERAEAALSLRIVGDGLQITTERLPEGRDGAPYEVALGALGGEGRYGWFLVEGRLPAGLALRADGVIEGVPAEVGELDFTVRVVDSARPPAFAERALRLQVAIAPLRIVADQILELFVTRIVTLPLITVIRDIPLPYRAQLQAEGGLRPHRWREVELPAGLRPFIPNSGLPDGLVLTEDGVVEGAVVDPSQIIEVPIPFTDIVLTGFFFFAEVSDQQEPPASQQAIFVLPTLPIGG